MYSFIYISPCNSPAEFGFRTDALQRVTTGQSIETRLKLAISKKKEYPSYEKEICNCNVSMQKVMKSNIKQDWGQISSYSVPIYTELRRHDQLSGVLNWTKYAMR